MAGPDLYTDVVWKYTKGNVNKKLENARPYSFFLTPVDANVSTHTEALTLSFPGILLLILLKYYKLSIINDICFTHFIFKNFWIKVSVI